MNKTGITLGSVVGLTLAVLFFWVFVFNIWFSNNILNRENFVNTTTQVLTTEASRNAIANEVVELTQDSFPIIGTAAAPLITKVVVGVLDTEIFTNIYTNLSEEIYYQLTTAQPKALELNIGGVLSMIQPFLDEQDAALVNSIPSKITLIGENEVPSLYQFSNTLAILGPLSLLAGLLILGVMWRKMIDKRNYFITLGLIMSATGFLVFSLIPVVGNSLVSGVSSSNGIFLLTELYNAFTESLVSLSLAVLVLGLFIAFVAKFVKRSAFKLPQTSSTK